MAARPDGVRPAGRQPRCPTAPRRWRRPTPGTSSAATPRASGRAGAAARRARRRRRPAARPAPQGLRAHAVRARRGRPGRGRPDAARVRRQRGDARPRHPDDPLAGRRRDRATGAPRDRAAGRRARPGREQPPARRAASSTPAATGDLDLLRRLADHAIARHHPGAADADARTSRCSRRSSPPRRRWSPSGCSSGSCTA